MNRQSRLRPSLVGRNPGVVALHLIEVGLAFALARSLGDARALGTVLVRRAILDSETLGASPQNLKAALDGVSLLEGVDSVDLLELLNAAILAAELGQLDLAEAYGRRAMDQEEAQLGRTTGDGEAILASVAVARGDLPEGIRLIRRGAERGMELKSLMYASSDWAALASYLTWAERFDDALDAVTRSAEVAALVGVDYLEGIAPRMRIAAAASDFDTVMTLGRGWFDRVRKTVGPIDFFTRNTSHVLEGEACRVPSFLNVLLPLTEAFLAGSQGEGGCRLVRAAPSLMASANFSAWDGIGETGRWQRLAAGCPRSDEPIEMTLEEAFEEAAELLRVG